MAVRMGLRYVKGLGEADGRAVVASRPFASLADLVRRTRLDAGALQALAEAGALDALGVDRRTALWEIKRLVRTRDRTLPIEDRVPEGRLFAPLDHGETIAWDYRSTDLSTRGHPLEIVRDQLRRQGIPDARTVAGMPGGRRIRYAGAQICRQQPGTAHGVVFLTLEDETGFVNVILWPKVYAKSALVVKTSPLLGVTGKLESQQGVIHLIADRVWVPQVGRPAPDKEVRDFH
jgi:error-prone DNA polymerase